MKLAQSIALATAAALAVGGLALPARGAPGPTDRPTPPAPTVPTRTASATLAEDLTFMREEERLARDLYRAFAEEYGSNTAFDRIASSEQRHFDAIGRLLRLYGLDDPSAGLAPGTYAQPTLTAMYDELLALGRKSIDDAYEAGIAVEEADIEDLANAIARTTAPEAKHVLESLKRGSERHLAAYTTYRNGSTPTPGAQRGRGIGQAGQAQRHRAEEGQGMRGQGPRALEDRPAGCPRN